MLEQLIAMLEEVKSDVMYSVDEDEHYVEITWYDFIGFDDDWDEIYRDYDDEEKVAGVMDWLHKHCVSSEGDFYEDFHFDGFDVCVGYSSMDI